MGRSAGKHYTVDLLPDRIAEAKSLSPCGIRLHCGHAADLPLASDSFDLVVQSTVFTSILEPSVKRQVASEMRRILKTDGLILWYDFQVNNPRNSDVQGVTRQEIYELFPNCRIELRRLTLAPPLLRLLAPYSWLLCHLLSQVPWLCTHYLGAIRKT
jgi:ubiquinone/menaquinone biosynthesis C-methylase UbiE